MNSAADVTRSLGRRLRRIPPVVLAPALLVVALMSWAFASPVGSSPDDDFHLSSIWCAEGARDFACEPGAEPSQRVVPEAVAHGQLCYARDADESAACQDPLLTSPADVDTLTERGGFANEYPPVYYGVMGLLVTPDVSTSVLLMRTLNILLFAGIATVLFLLLPRALRAPMVWGWALTSVPLSVFLISSNNPSSWAVIGVGTVWISLVGYLQSTGRRKVALGAVFALGVVMAAGARADSAVYAVLSMGIVLVLTARRDRRYLLDAILPVAMALVALAFFVTTRQSTVLESGLSDSTTGELAGAESSIVALIGYNLLNVPSLWAGVFGGWGLGWLDTLMPYVVIAGGTIAFLVATAVGIGREWPRKVISIALLVLGIWLIPTFVLVQGGQQVGNTVQPRYILPLMIVLAGVAMITRDRPQRWGRFQVFTIGAVLAVANSVALHTNIRRYVTGVDHQGPNLDAGREWWWNVPFTPMIDWAVGSLAFAALVFLLARALILESAREAPDEAVDEGYVGVFRA